VSHCLSDSVHDRWPDEIPTGAVDAHASTVSAGRGGAPLAGNIRAEEGHPSHEARYTIVRGGAGEFPGRAGKRLQQGKSEETIIDDLRSNLPTYNRLHIVRIWWYTPAC